MINWFLSAPIATCATYTYPYDVIIKPKFFLVTLLPEAANLATAAVGVALDDCPPVFEYTSVSITNILTSEPDARTWSNPPNPIS